MHGGRFSPLGSYPPTIITAGVEREERKREPRVGQNGTPLIMTPFTGYNTSQDLFLTTEAFRDLIENAESKFVRAETESEGY